MVNGQRFILAVFLWLGLAVPALADPPIPPLSGRVVDLAHILDSRTADALTRQLADHEAATTNQVVVVTLPDLKGYSIEDWGRALLNGWGIGQRDKNNGVVLVVAPNDRRLRIEVGYGLDDVLTTRGAARIIETEIVPRFKREDMQGGITAGVNAILGTIAGTYRSLPPVEQDRSGRRDLSSFVPFAIFPMIFLAVVVIGLLRRGNPIQPGPYYGNTYDGSNSFGTRFNRRDQDGWGSRSSGFSSGGSSSRGSGGFSGGGGRGGGGGASGRW
jgi:uncharacterized protein